MTIKRFLFTALTLLVTLLITISLLGSLTKPQVQGQLELYQTNLVLQASLWQGFEQQSDSGQMQRAVLGNDPLQDAIDEYEQVEKSLRSALDQANQELPQPELPTTVNPNSEARRLQAQLDQVDLRLGLLDVKAGQLSQGQQLWQELMQRSRKQSEPSPTALTAAVLSGLWEQPPRLLPNAEAQLRASLDGWFRYQGLSQLYLLQQRQEAFVDLTIASQQQAESALVRLAIVGGLPALASLLGSGVLLVWLVRGFLRRKLGSGSTTGGTIAPEIPAASHALQAPAPVTWERETIWQVMVLWFTAFFGISLLQQGIMAAIFGSDQAIPVRNQGLLALLNYSLLMFTGLAILWLFLRPFVAQPAKWLPLRLRGGWFWWGVGGYLAALPLVILVSLLAQRLLQDQGGGNPILEIIIHGRDNFTLLVLFLMVAVLAPVFEETLFRGFFLTSLTRYLSPWGAIALSGVVFAIAHLNIADILPLSVLGMMLGYVYLRSGNLLASMLLHSIWNSGSFIGLLILGSGSG